MTRQRHAGYKVLDEHKLALDYAIHSRSKRRCALGALAFLLAATLLVLAYLPIVINKMVPILWVHEANMFGLTPGIQDSILRLLANGRIQVFKGYTSILLSMLAIIPAWVSALLFINRMSETWHGGAFNLNYWREFYLIRPFRVHTFSTSPTQKSPASISHTKKSPA